jgi:hypothetical protein
MEMFDGIRLKERPDDEPDVVKMGARTKKCIIQDTATQKAYSVIKENPNKAYTSSELADIVKEKVHSCILRELWKRGFVHRTSFKVPSFGKYGAYLYSWSQKSLWKRLMELMPEGIKKCIALIYRKPYEILCVKELMDLTDAKPYEVSIWLDRVFGTFMEKEFGFKFIGKRMIKGIRTFYYHPSMSDDVFRAKYEFYYKDKVLKERSICKFRGEDFQEWASWSFAEYLKLKGNEVERVRMDREPVDYILKVRMNISDLLTKKEREITTHKFVVSCKEYLHSCVSGNYVIGLSGCVREGFTFNGEQIFQARNSVPVILCVKANNRAWNLASKLGVLIFDVHKLLKMYDIVEQSGQTHPLFSKIKLRIEGYKERQKLGR